MAGHLVIVRRGKPSRFGALVTAFQGEPEVTICWDRRQRARRLARTRRILDRRRTRDRRGLPPVTWSVLDFLVTTGAAPR